MWTFHVKMTAECEKSQFPPFSVRPLLFPRKRQECFGSDARADRHLEVLWGFVRHQVREEFQQKHQSFLAVCMEASASTERHLKRVKKKIK